MKHSVKKGVFMKTIVFLVADYANLSIDRKLNIMGIFNQIFATNFPAIHPSMHLVIEVGMEPDEDIGPHKITVYRMNESQTEKIKIFEREFKFPPRTGGLMPKHTAIVGLRQMGFIEPGTYEFLLHINDRFLDKLPLHLAKAEVSIKDKKKG